MLKRRLLVISFAALCLSVAPAMADFVELTASQTKMTVTATNTTIIEPLYPGGSSTMDMFIKDDGGNVLQSLIAEPYNLTAMLDFTGSGNNYSATGSLKVYDNTSDVDPKISAEFETTILTFDSLPPNPFTGPSGILTMTGYLTPTPPDTSILLGDPWEFVGATTITLGNSADFDQGTMVVFEYIVQFGTLQDYLAEIDAQGSGMLIAQVHSTPIPAAVLLGVIGLGIVGLKLRKYT